MKHSSILTKTPNYDYSHSLLTPNFNYDFSVYFFAPAYISVAVKCFALAASPMEVSCFDFFPLFYLLTEQTMSLQLYVFV